MGGDHSVGACALPTKLAVKLNDDGRTEVVSYEMPDPDEVKRLWRQGLSLGQIREELMNKGKKKKKP